MNLLSLRGYLRTQSALRGLFVAVGVALLVFMMAVFGGFAQTTGAANEATQENERSLLLNYLEVSMRSNASVAKGQLTSDDAFAAAGHPDRPVDKAWADINLGSFFQTDLRADLTYLVAPDGQLLRSWRDGKPDPAGGLPPLAASIKSKLGSMEPDPAISDKPAGNLMLSDVEWPIDRLGQPLSRMTSWIDDVDGKPSLITMVSIVPDHNFREFNRKPNSVVVVRKLDDDALAAIGSELLLKDMRVATAAPNDLKRTAIQLSALDGRHLAWLSWQSNDVGTMVYRKTGPLIALYFAFYVLVLAGGGVVVRNALKMARDSAKREAEAQRDAMFDPMLGLPNRKFIMKHVGEAIANRDPAEAVFLAYLDLDHFKSINEAIGHPLGDEVLIETVRRIKAALSPDDLLGRLASDEFVIVHRAPGGKDQASALGEAILSAFHEPFAIQGTSLPVTASCGIAWAPELSADANELLRLADIALFRAKQRGRGRYRYFTEDMNASIRWRQDMEVELRRAIADNELQVLYQPIIHVADRRVVSFEALVRWPHKDRGQISPGVFVPLAEHCGLMPQLGEWVLRRVFADSARFGDAELSINLSPVQLAARDFLSQLKAIIEETGVAPERFAFEITEGVLLENSDRMLALLGEIRDMGFRIALDDFGTGFSSLSYLRSFQFDRIKIDRSFVQGIENDLDAQAILKTIVSLGRTLRMKVIAEGVETLLQQQLVEASGCELIQGHLHARAMPVARAAALVTERGAQRLRLAAG